MNHTGDDLDMVRDMSLNVPMTPLKAATTPSPDRFSSSRPSMFSGFNLPSDVKMALNDAHGVCRQMSTTDAPCSSAMAAAAAATEETKVAHLEAATVSSEAPHVQIQNIVATCNLGTTLDLKHLALHARNAEYNPKRFSAVIMRIREPRTTALIFSSGKVVVTGAKSEGECRLASRKYGRIIQKLGMEVKFLDFKVQNMVGSTDVRFAIHLEALFITHSQFATYEPELFPGLIYRMVNPRVVLLIFVSGKIVITGAKTREAIQTAFCQIYPVVKSFKK